MSENVLPSSSIPYSPVSQTTSSDEETKNASPRISIITGIAMIAIALAVCGVLGLVTKFSTQVTGLGAFSRLPLWVSSGMAFSGGAGVIVLMIWAVCQCKENQNQKSFDDSDYQTPPEGLEPIFTKVKERLKITDMRAHLHALYGNGPLPKLPFNSERNSFEKYLEFCLLTSEQLLFLPIKDIKNYDEIFKKCLRDRLSSIQEIPPQLPQQEMLLFPPTFSLGQLRQLNPTSLLRYLDQTDKKDLSCILSFITSTQLQNPAFPWKSIAEDRERIKALFSLNNASYDESKRILQLLGSDAIAIIAPALSAEQLRLLSDRQFQDPKFPWELIAKDQKTIEGLFRTDGPYRFLNPITKTSQHILRLLRSDAIAIVAPVLSGFQLRMLSNQQFQDPVFPWAKIAANHETIEDLFCMGSTESKNESERILQLLGSDAIAIMAPILSGFQLRMLSDAQFTDSEFPWDRIVENPQTVTDLFQTDSAARAKSQHILQLLGRRAMNHLGYALSENQLAMLSDEQREPSFCR